MRTGLAQRRYYAADPANRLVAAPLERDWNERLRELGGRHAGARAAARGARRRALGAAGAAHGGTGRRFRSRLGRAGHWCGFLGKPITESGRNQIGDWTKEGVLN